MERIVKIIQHLEGKIHKGDHVAQVSQEDNDSVHVEKPSINKHTLRGLDFNNGSNQGWSPRGIQLPKIGMRKFDGKEPIPRIFQMEKFFDIHQMENLQKVTIASLYLEPHQFGWYQ